MSDLFQNKVLTNKVSTSKISDIRVLVQAREDLYLNHGGDTVAIESSIQELKKLGANVKLDIKGTENPKNFDLVHIYNFCTPKAIEKFALNALEKNVPFVVTTLYEDRINFFLHMHVYASGIMNYIENNQLMSWDDYNLKIKYAIEQSRITNKIENRILAEYAEVLITSGEKESYLIKRDYPNVKSIEICRFGSTRLPEVNKNIFYDTYGIKDYVLSVGRIEVRKNQGLLLKSLEDCDLPVVLVAGKMTYNPDYEEAISRFKRKGKNLIVRNLSPEMLASAYAGAKVHALPSWYELPGLVSLEAAINGANIVSSNSGTIESYLGKTIKYCSPDDTGSIKKSILEAYNSAPDIQLKEIAKSFTWEKTARRLIEIYEYTLNKKQTPSLRESIDIEVNNQNSRIFREPYSKYNELFTK